MARASKQRSRSITINQRVRVTITPAPFHLFESVRQLDVARLKRAARQRIEVGYFESECCRRMVHAVVRKGQVVKLELEPCEGGAPATADTEQVARAALKRLGVKPGGGKVLPVPVETFVSNAARFTWGSTFSPMPVRPCSHPCAGRCTRSRTTEPPWITGR